MKEPAPEKETPPRRPRRRARVAMTLMLLVGLYALGGFVGVPWVARRWIVPAVDAGLAGSLRIDSIRCNPFAWSLELGAGELRTPEGQRVLAFERVRLNFDPFASLLTMRWQFREVIIEAPAIDIEIDPQGSIDIVRALAPTSPVPPDAEAGNEPLLRRIPHIVVLHGSVASASLRVTDRSRNEVFEATWDDAVLRFDDLRLLPLTRSQQRLTASGPDGARLHWEGSITVDPPHLRGEATLTGLQLAPLMPYLSAATTARIVGGTLEARASYEFAPTDTPPVARVMLHEAVIDDIRVMDEQTLLLHAPTLRLVGTQLDLVGRRASIHSLRISQGDLHAVRDESGQPAILRLFPWAAAEAAEAVPAEATPEPGELPEFPVERVAAAFRAIVRGATRGWQVRIESVACHEQRLRFTDRSTRKVVEVSLDRASLTAGPIESATGFETPFALEGAVNGDGLLTVQGMLAPLRIELQCTVDAQGVGLAPFAPYMPARPIPDLDEVELVDGTASVSGRVTALVNLAQQAIKVEWQGRASVADLRADRTSDARPMATLGALAADGRLDAALGANHTLALSWDGATTLSAAAIDLPVHAQALRGSIGEASVSGPLSLSLDPAQGASLEWRGEASLRAAEATVALQEAAGQIAGDAGSAHRAGLLRATGSLRLGASPAAPHEHDPAASGTVAASEAPASGRATLAWKGQFTAESLSSQRPGIGDRVDFLELAALSFDGDVTGHGSMHGGALTLRSDGALAAMELAGALRRSDQGADLAVKEIRLGGTTAFELISEPPAASLSWNGSFNVAGVAGRQHSKSLGDHDIDAAALAFDGAVDARADPSAEGIGNALLHARGRLDATSLAALRKGTELAGSLGVRAVVADGETKVTVAHAQETTAAWMGVLSIDRTSAEVSLPGAGSQRGTIASFRYAGDAGLLMGGRTPPSFRADGGLISDGIAIAATTPTTGPIDLGFAGFEYGGAFAAAPGTAGEGARVELVGEAIGREMTLAVPELERAKLRVQHWRASHMDIDLRGNRATIGELAVKNPHAEFEIALADRVFGSASDTQTDDGPSDPARIDASDAELLEAPRSALAASSVAEETIPPELPDLEIRELRLEQAALTLLDRSTTPPTMLLVSEVDAAIDGLATRQDQATTIDMEGRIQESADFTLRGSLHPFAPARSTTLALTLSSLPLKHYDPYANRFVGYEIESGRLTLDVPVTVEDSALEGTVNATLDRFYLGRETPSPDAPDLPIKLGLDLLRDSGERITVNIPFSGDLRDPSFNLGGVVWQAVMNLLLKATTAPFTLLGSLVGAGDRDLSLVTFEPGSSELAPDRLADLDLLAQALAERPAVKVRAIGQRSDAADLDGLRRAALRQRLRASAKVAEGAPFDGDAVAQALERAFRDLPRELRRSIEPPGGGAPTREAMERLLLDGIEIDPTEIQALARARSERVAAALIAAGVAAERVVVEVASEPSDGPPSVTFELE